MTIEALELELTKIYDTLVTHEPDAIRIAKKVHPNYRLSAINLYRYLFLRTFDLRNIHDSLTELGLSSLRSAEGYVYTNIINVLNLIHLLQGKEWISNETIECIGYQKSKKLLRNHAKNLFVDTHKKRRTEIMVTLPEEAAEDLDYIKKLIDAGMEVARINLGRDNMAQWQKMVDNIDLLRKETGTKLKVYMDLAGPKLRVADMEVQLDDDNVKSFIRVKKGERILITKNQCKGRPTLLDENGNILEKAKIGVLLPQIIDDVQIGHRVYFDDGKIKAVVVEKNHDEIEIEITNAAKSKLGSKKGINLPDTYLNLAALTDRDRSLLPFVCEHADIIGYSFIQTPEDVRILYSALDELEEYNREDIGVVFKIETERAFNNMPMILFEAMKHEKLGVMIARGDLAVEIGFERISEVQNEIMWICEAAHIPVIWATEVLQNLSKKGVATRAEVSDAAISSQAECVMLNKGPYILEAILTLKSIIKRMEKHYSKKKSKLRALQVAIHTLEQLHDENSEPQKEPS